MAEHETRDESGGADAEKKPKVWLKPEQIRTLMRTARFTGADYLQGRNEALIAFVADTGLRPGEAVQVRVDYLNLEEGVVHIPQEIQKDHPHPDSSPSDTTIALDRDDDVSFDTIPILRKFLDNRIWDADGLFPSRESEFMTVRSFQNVVATLREEAGVRPYRESFQRADVDELTPHVFRHSVPYRMLHECNAYSLYDVRNRLRHTTIRTTERVYDHFDVV